MISCSCDCCVDKNSHKNCAPDKIFKLTIALMQNTEKTMKNELIIREKIKDMSAKDIGTKKWLDIMNIANQ